MSKVIGYKDRAGMVYQCDDEFAKSMSAETISSLGVSFYLNTPADKERLANDFRGMHAMFNARSAHNNIPEIGAPETYTEGKTEAAIAAVLHP